ncbi:MAG: hypothetical protein AAF637_28340 [Pseudomonadota bacterium]
MGTPEIEIVSPTSATTEIRAKRHGVMVLGLRVLDAAGKVLEPESANYAILSVPAFVVVHFDHGGSFGALRGAYGIDGASWNPMVSTLAGIVHDLLERANVRLVWKDPDIATPTPSQLATQQLVTTGGSFGIDQLVPFGGRVRSHGPWVQVSVHGEPPAASLPGDNPGETLGATEWSLVHIFPGSLNPMLSTWGHGALQLSPATFGSLPDQIGPKMFARFLAQGIAHEVIHALRYEWESRQMANTPPGMRFNPHIDPAQFPEDLMTPGGARRLTLRTGIAINPDGTPTDLGTAAMAKPLPGASLSIFDTSCPRPGHGMLSG